MKRVLFLLLVLLFGTPSWAAIAALTHTAKAQVGSGVTSTAIDTTGATLLVVAAHSWAQSTSTVSDSKSNTWLPLTAYGQNSTCGWVKIYYAYATSGKVGTGHTFTVTAGAYNGITVSSYSGTSTSVDPYQAASDHGNYSGTNVTTIKPGSVTPAEAGDLIVTAWTGGDSTVTSLTLDLGFTRTDLFHDSNEPDASMAYLVVANTNAVDLTWTMTSGKPAASVAIFKPAGGAAGKKRGLIVD